MKKLLLAGSVVLFNFLYAWGDTSSKVVGKAMSQAQQLNNSASSQESKTVKGTGEETLNNGTTVKGEGSVTVTPGGSSASSTYSAIASSVGSSMMESITCRKNMMPTGNSSSNAEQCYDAYDLFTEGFKSDILTKTAGKTFALMIAKTNWGTGCDYSHKVNVELVDAETNEAIPNTKKTVSAGGGVAVFRVPEAYRNVRVKIDYDVDNPFEVVTEKEITCPTEGAVKATFNYILNNKSEGIYYVPQSDGSLKCYQVVKEETTHPIDYSSDNFAIKPEKFDIQFKQKSVKVGRVAYADIKAVSYEGDITTNYNSNSELIKTSINSKTGKYEPKVNYSFDIVNGEEKRGYFVFNREANNTSIKLTEMVGEEWAVVDADDTADSCRLVTGVSNDINITPIPKDWAGRGTGMEENDPIKHNVDVDVRDNVNKDIRFNKMNW